jgi:hypothetical protein
VSSGSARTHSRQTDLLIRLAEAAGFGIASARERAPRRHGDRARRRVPGGVQGALGAPDPLRFPSGRRHPDRAALHTSDAGSSTWSPRSRRSSRLVRTSAHRRRGAAPAAQLFDHGRDDLVGLRRRRSPSARASVRSDPC